MIAVVIPAFNAAQTLGTLLEQVSRVIDGASIIVVDDGSTDDTSAIASEAGARVIRHRQNRGKGAALRSGFEAVLASKEYAAVITMDADLQHDPMEVPKFISRSESGKADIVVGFRKRIGSGMPLHRVLSNRITSSLVSARTGVMIKDSQSGFRWVSREVLAAIAIESEGYEAETEMLIKAARKGFLIDFVPITTIYGNERSHMSHWKTTKRFLQVLLKEY